MSTIEGESICSFAEYEVAWRNRLRQEQLSSHEIYTILLRIAGEDAAFRSTVMTPLHVPKHAAPACLSLELSFLDPDFLERFRLNGDIRNGLWSPVGRRLLLHGREEGAPELIDGIILGYNDGVTDDPWLAFEKDLKNTSS